MQQSESSSPVQDCVGTGSLSELQTIEDLNFQWAKYRPPELTHFPPATLEQVKRLVAAMFTKLPSLQGRDALDCSFLLTAASFYNDLPEKLQECLYQKLNLLYLATHYGWNTAIVTKAIGSDTPVVLPTVNVLTVKSCCSFICLQTGCKLWSILSLIMWVTAFGVIAGNGVKSVVPHVWTAINVCCETLLFLGSFQNDVGYLKAYLQLRGLVLTIYTSICLFFLGVTFARIQLIPSAFLPDIPKSYYEEATMLFCYSSICLLVFIYFYIVAYSYYSDVKRQQPRSNPITKPPNC